jgi:hypothetical protein
MALPAFQPEPRNLDHGLVQLDVPITCAGVSRSKAGGSTMHRVILLAVLLSLVAVTSSRAQNQDSRPLARQGEITIPSEKTLERDAVTSPKNEFSRDDATATRQMERQNMRIDREVKEGICVDC